MLLNMETTSNTLVSSKGCCSITVKKEGSNLSILMYTNTVIRETTQDTIPIIDIPKEVNYLVQYYNINH